MFPVGEGASALPQFGPVVMTSPNHRSSELALKLRPLHIPFRHFQSLASQFLAMSNLLFRAFSRSRIFLISPLQPTVNAPDFFFHSSRIRAKPQQRPSN